MNRWRWVAPVLFLTACSIGAPAAPRAPDAVRYAGASRAASRAASPAAPAAAPATALTPAPAAGAVQQLLDRRSAAVLSRNAAAFDSTVSSQASTGERNAQLAAFRSAAVLPLRSWSLQIAGAAGNPPPSGRWVVPVTLRYALEGYDSSPVDLPRTLALTEAGSGWAVAADSQHDAPWDFGPLVVVTGARSLVIAHPAEAAAARRVGMLADAAVPVVTWAWGSDWSQRVVIIVPSTLAELQADLVTGNDLSQLAAVQSVELDGPHPSTGSRILLNPVAYFHSISELGQRVILTHEITHVASQAATTAGVPLWLVEGLADTVGFGTTTLTVRQGAPELAAQLARQPPPSRLPADADFAAPSAHLVIAYEQAWLACLLIEQRVGIAGLVAFYRAVGSGLSVETAMMGSLHTTLATFVAAWRAALRTELA